MQVHCTVPYKHTAPPRSGPLSCQTAEVRTVLNTVASTAHDDTYKFNVPFRTNTPPPTPPFPRPHPLLMHPTDEDRTLLNSLYGSKNYRSCRLTVLYRTNTLSSPPRTSPSTPAPPSPSPAPAHSQCINYSGLNTTFWPACSPRYGICRFIELYRTPPPAPAPSHKLQRIE